MGLQLEDAKMMNHYEILELPSPSTNNIFSTTDDVKQAYRLALLKHHPDKHRNPRLSAEDPSVDDIKEAFAVLSDPKLRAEYDRGLLLLHKRNAKDEKFQTGEEVVDLDDLEFDETHGLWYRACRCGEDRGYIITEQQLENEENDTREVRVGCRGCSLWIRVGFSIVEDAEDETGAHGRTNADGA